MDFKEKKLYHQIHPLKLATDIGVVPPALYFLWQHRSLPAAVIAFIPPVLVSAVMMKWPPDLERLKSSRLGRYIKKSMPPGIEGLRLISLVPMAYGAWKHRVGYILLGLLVLVVAWCNGLIWQRRRADTGSSVRRLGDL